MLQGAAIRWLELNRNWRQWGRAWLSTVKSAQLILPIDASGDLDTSDPEQTAEKQRERVAALVRQCPGCTSVRLRIKQEPFYDTTVLGESNESDYAESDSESPSSEIDDERPAPPDTEDPLDINAGLCALSELMGPRLLKLDLGNSCSRDPPASGYLKSVGIFMDEGLASVAAHCPNLVALDLSYCSPAYTEWDTACRSFVGVHPATLLRLVESCGHSLKSLNIAGVLCSIRWSTNRRSTIALPSTDLPPAVLSEMIQHCPALEYLNIKETDDLIVLTGHHTSNDEDALPPYVTALISTCANLECLDVRNAGIYLWDAECLTAVVEGCRNLKKIRWSSGSRITKETRLAVAQRHPHVSLEGGDFVLADWVATGLRLV